MNMREHFHAFYKVLTADETLLRLLYYKPENALDNPLAVEKQNVLDMQDKWKVIEDVIKTTPKTDDLTTKSKCRLFLYLGRRGNTPNYLLADQEIIFDVLVGMDWQEKDQRQLWICDRISELVNEQFITGTGRVKFKTATPIPAPESFLGFRMIYEIGSTK